MESISSTARTEFFQEVGERLCRFYTVGPLGTRPAKSLLQLKPRCVAINDLAVRSQDKRAVAKQLIAVTEEVSDALERQVKKDASILDEKLAGYIFFPLSNILRYQQQFPVRLTELTIKCLRILIEFGWKSKIEPDLSQQLLIFLTYVIGGVPGETRKEAIPEETTIESLRALASLIAATGSSTAGSKSLVEDKNLPTIGHTISVILDTVNKGETAEVQLEALHVVDAVFTAIKQPAILASFLPGIVSSLTKLLSPPPAWKTPRKVLVKGIAALKSVLVNVLADIKVTKLLKEITDSKDGKSKDEKDSAVDNQIFTAPWLKATASQIKIALASILKLRTHKSEDVQTALERLCIGLLDECRQSLSICTAILVETAMVLSAEEENHSLIQAGLNTSLVDLTSIYPELIDVVKTTVYNFVTSLPRIMQSSDENVKQQAIRNLLKGQRLLSTLRIDSSTLNDTMAASLRDSVSTLLSSGVKSNVAELSSTDLVLSSGDLAATAQSTQFQPFLMNHSVQKSTRNELLTLIAKSGTFAQHATLARDMIEYLRESTGNSQVASYWLSFELVKAGLASSSELDEFLDFGSADTNEDHEELLQELYIFSVELLNSDEDAEVLDWRLQSLALEVAAYTASRMKADFRPELIDVLYPISTNLGSLVPQLREHAIIALNSIAMSCGYANVADLVIENVDYMLNSVSLRLNTFDISPASTQVLRMMIRLTGPRLIPYLDDVVASIFGALENYHGYPLFVENLFAVLAEVVNQGAKSNQLLLEDDSRSTTDHQKHPRQMVKIEDIVKDLSRRSDRKKRRLNENDEIETINHPEKPWKRGKTGEESPEDDEEEPSQDVEKKPPTTTTYTLLTRITSLTQHYLTSPTPSLRKSLLDLLAMVCPALSPDEETFLPVVNSIWPVLLERLYDQESFVVTSACKALSALCASAGDFLSSRVETTWSDGLRKWIAKRKSLALGNSSTSKRRMVDSKQRIINTNASSDLVMPIRSAGGLEAKEPLKPLDLSSTTPTKGAVVGGGLGEFTQARQIWEAVQELLVAIVSFVRIDDDMFDDILALFGGDGLARNQEAKKALEAVNEDAVWLVLYEEGRVDLLNQPENATEVEFVELCRPNSQSIAAG
ncbi:hypothetical protein PFICI_11767 [Pestalotiopsis fici W106-1]|uniref:TEL2-interacting protein 1 n=1 Tax=Pestalotiopsis fici (strain W106-1 / CGMCC3.15140) TaxID=1229662 RepID=W3WR86_PESFW|nr:uncharacterized protein PFICI_11767 [Pestalotiopsis fici W106-1]ETS76380.1 hypothetical protein PFICI_11767 [Pestalotiopsis fici W106-1]